MQFHLLKPYTRSKREKRVGRGGKRGTTSGRGTKGQKARAGAKIRPAIRDIIKKLPKRRGYRFRPFRPKPAVVDLAAVADAFLGGGVIDPASLITKGLLRKRSGSTPAVKVLGNAPIKKKLFFRGIAFSHAARASVLAAGGSIQ